MSTTIQKAEIGERFVFHGMDWRSYLHFLRAVGDRPLRHTYDRGTLEVMSPTLFHEHSKSLLARFVEMLALEANFPILCAGSTTLKRQRVQRGVEPDECYYIKNLAKVRGKKRLNLQTDPPPDLALEMDVTASSLDRLAVYAKLGVPEVWRYDGKSLQVYLLQAGGTYRVSKKCLAFPMLPILAAERLLLASQAQDPDDTTSSRRFQAWVHERIAKQWKG